jgi:hypothetical protein
MSTSNGHVPTAEEFDEANPEWVTYRTCGHAAGVLKHLRDEVLKPGEYRQQRLRVPGRNGSWRSKPCWVYLRTGLKDATDPANVNKRRSEKLATNPEEERIYKTPAGNRLNLAAALKRLDISRPLFYARQRKRLWIGIDHGKIPSEDTPLLFDSSKETEPTYLEAHVELARQSMHGARTFRVVDAEGEVADPPAPFKRGKEIGWHDRGTYYGTSPDGLTGFWITMAEAARRFPRLPLSSLNRYALHEPCKYLVDREGNFRNVRWMPAPAVPIITTEDESRVLWLSDVQRIADGIQAQAAAFTDENGVVWPTQAQAKAMFGVTKAFLRKWVARHSKLRPDEKALATRDVTNPWRGPNKVDGYCAEHIIYILSGLETNTPGTGTGCSANNLRALIHQDAEIALLTILPKGQSLPPSTIFKRAHAEYGLSGFNMRQALLRLGGDLDQESRPWRKGQDFLWRLPDDAYEKYATVIAQPPVLPPLPFVPSKFQERILAKLKYKALTTEQLQHALGDVDRKYLFASGLNPLKEAHLIENHRRLGGYFRRDCPPPKLAKILEHASNPETDTPTVETETPTV